MPEPNSPAPIALVTGAAKRLGRAVSLGLARAGMDVAIHYQQSDDDAATLAEEIGALGRRAWTFPADLSKTDDATRLIARVTESAGPIAGLINNASIYPEDRLLDLAEDALLQNIRVNAWAPFVLARAVAAQGRPASVINFLDTRMRDYDARHVSYHLSKRMLFSLTRMMALEFAPAVRVNAIAPGLVLPPPGKNDAYLKELAPTNPLNTHGDTGDIVRSVLFLLESSFITGQVIYVDGGRHMLGGLYDSEPRLDRICIRDLTVECIVGVNPEERTQKQLIVINIAMHTDLSRPGGSDALADTIDYKTVKVAVMREVEQSQYQLIERLAERIAEIVLEFGVTRVDVCIDKPGALRFARSVAVEISRSRKP